MPADSAVDLEPLYASAKQLLDADRLDDAAAIYRDILGRNPNQPRALNNLGTILEAQGRSDIAIGCYQCAIDLDPGVALIHYNLGHLYQTGERLDEAVVAYRNAIAIKPSYRSAHFNLTQALIDLGRSDEALTAVDAWLASDPGEERALHLRAALSGAAVPARASDDFVRNVFDAVATGFDESLTALQYRAPQLVAEALAEPRPAVPLLDVLDAGCGTGLCGPLLRGQARRLVGVDLSPGMLAQARQRGIYDELVEAEIVDYLRGCVASWDAIIAADALVYFGPLDTVLAAASVALRPGGRLIGTLEALPEGQQPHLYALDTTGRFRHGKDYLRRCLAAATLVDGAIQAVTLRREAGQPVAGWLFSASRPSQS